MSNILKKICDVKREHVKESRSLVSYSTLESKCVGRELPRGFINAIRSSLCSKSYKLIAEIKRASPSKGLIRENFNPVELAKSYESGGATCISVLTDEPYFKGKLSYIKEVRNVVSVPILRKDFIIDAYQIMESRAAGADCILLIMAALSDKEAQEFEAEAHSLNMDVLIEVHNEDELERAMNLVSPLIGINNRNLKTLEIDISVSERLLKKLPSTKVAVSESGLYTQQDLDRVASAGAQCFLVGESLMRQEDVEVATRKLVERRL